MPNVFLILNLGANLDRTQKPQGNLEKNSNILAILKESCWILFYAAQELRFILQPILQGFRWHPCDLLLVQRFWLLNRDMRLFEMLVFIIRIIWILSNIWMATPCRTYQVPGQSNRGLYPKQEVVLPKSHCSFQS